MFIIISEFGVYIISEMVELWSVKTLVCFYYQSYCHLQSSTGQTILRDFAHTCNLVSSSLLIWKSQISLMLKAPQSEIIIVIHYICLRSAVCCTLSLSLCLLPATDYVSGPGLRWWEAPSLPAAPSLSLICSSRCLSLSLVCPSLCLASFKLCLCSVSGRRPNVWVLTCPDLLNCWTGLISTLFHIWPSRTFLSSPLCPQFVSHELPLLCMAVGHMVGWFW